MEFNYDLIQRAQMLLSLEHSSTSVRDILLREGYPQDQVLELMAATEEALNYLVPPQYDEHKIGIDILCPGENRQGRTPTVDILIDRRSGKMELITSDQQQTWRVANEVRKAIKRQRQPSNLFH